MGKKNETKKTTKGYSEAGKGDIPRRGISQDRWEERWEKIFGKKGHIGLQNSRPEGDGTEWLIERDEQGKLYRRMVGTEIKEYINDD